MKYIKITLILFIVSLVFVSFKVNAIEGMVNVQGFKLPAFSKLIYVTSGTKTEENLQYYYNIGNVNLVTGNYNSVKVQILNETAGGGTNFLELSKGVAATWSTNADKDKIRSAGKYKLYAKNAVVSVGKSEMYGVWYLNKSRYDQNFN